ncbi:MAG: hypothetical protein AB7O62_05035 [Pirellulales bacterium]
MRHFSQGWRALVALCVVGTGSVVHGAEKLPFVKSGPYNADHQTVELFAALENGEIDVKFIPNDSTSAQVLIENKTQQPLNVRLPAAFAGVPVLGQFQQQPGGFFNGGGQRGGGQQGGGQNQSTGGGFGNGQQNGQQNGQANGNFFNVPAERVGLMKVKLVCLEHGKPEPRAAIPYKLVPIAEFSDKPEVAALCSLLGDGKVSQKSAQFAAWHLANDMSQEELASKKIHHLDGSSERFFTADQVRGGKLAVAEAEKMAQRAAVGTATSAVKTAAAQ